MPGYCAICTTHHCPEERHQNPVRTADEWVEMTGTIVYDPDGWDRRNFRDSWAEKIDRFEFRRRAWSSTVHDTRRWLEVAEAVA